MAGEEENEGACVAFTKLCSSDEKGNENFDDSDGGGDDVTLVVMRSAMMLKSTIIMDANALSRRRSARRRSHVRGATTTPQGEALRAATSCSLVGQCDDVQMSSRRRNGIQKEFRCLVMEDDTASSSSRAPLSTQRVFMATPPWKCALGRGGTAAAADVMSAAR